MFHRRMPAIFPAWGPRTDRDAEGVEGDRKDMAGVREYVFYVFFSDLKNMTFYVFFEMTFQKT